ncbi:hypothetical protein [Streptomyces sp. MMG1121]|uniref:hypothetical protein n=1 Tax=Streptomyces sp. MMG1121 TaxID=1415544 RepID=UPI0006AF59DC|nr:hypothetical protein [Streptomyces sp. MMG1121]KOV58187.1 hypothetical protein ADK64_37570 [Streptomyces sp. MMG1121]
MAHGIGPEEETEEQLRGDRRRPSAKPLRDNSRAEQAARPEDGSLSTAMAHYRRLHAPQVPQDDWAMPLPDPIAATGEDVTAEIMNSIQQHASDPATRAEVGLEQGPAGILRMFVAMLGRLGSVARSGFAALSGTGVFHLGQVAGYLDDETVRERAIEAVLTQVAPDTKAVLPHSLGTVVLLGAVRGLDHVVEVMCFNHMSDPRRCTPAS